jgi:hypothetical protein
MDESGCNTNQLDDGRVGGKLFVVPKDDHETDAPIRLTTDIHFTVLVFMSGIVEAVICAIIFKSDQLVSGIPSRKLELDIMCDANSLHRLPQ